MELGTNTATLLTDIVLCFYHHKRTYAYVIPNRLHFLQNKIQYYTQTKHIYTDFTAITLSSLVSHIHSCRFVNYLEKTF